MDLRKCLNPIRTSVGHPVFSWTIFGQGINCSKIHAFFTLWAYGAQFIERYCIVRFSLYSSNSQTTSGMQETIYRCNERCLRRVTGRPRESA